MGKDRFDGEYLRQIQVPAKNLTNGRFYGQFYENSSVESESELTLAQLIQRNPVHFGAIADIEFESEDDLARQIHSHPGDAEENVENIQEGMFTFILKIS